jgi:hypothetical protein
MHDLSENPDNLVPFLELVASNQKVSIAKFPAQYALIRRVNICLSTAGNKLINPKPVMCALLFLRCQYAYKAAAGAALSGQSTECFVLMRSVAIPIRTPPSVRWRLQKLIPPTHRFRHSRW